MSTAGMNVARLCLACTVATVTCSAAFGDESAIVEGRLGDKFSGRVVGPSGEPIRGARIYLTQVTDKPAGAPKLRTATGADGRFEFEAPDMTFIDHDGLPSRRAGFLVAVADEYGPDFLYTAGRSESRPRRKRDQARPANFKLRLAKDGVPIRGRLLAPDGEPLVGARVRLMDLLVPPDYDLDAHLQKEKKRDVFSCPFGYQRSFLGRPHLMPEVPETRTDADGRFTISGLGRERLAVLKATAPAIVDTSLTVMTRDAPDAQAPMGKRDAAIVWPPAFIFGANFTLREGTVAVGGGD